MTMRLLSVNVGQPRQVVWKGRTVTTGIFKESVAGELVALRWEQVDLKQALLHVTWLKRSLHSRWRPELARVT